MATNFYLKVDGIEGECQDHGFEKTMKVHEWRWSSSNTGSVGGTEGLSGGTVTVANLSFKKDFDAASPLIWKNITEGDSILSATLTGTKSTGSGSPEKFVEVLFHEIYFTNQQLAAAYEIPAEDASFAFGYARVSYWKQNEAGGTLTLASMASYDVIKKETT